MSSVSSLVAWASVPYAVALAVAVSFGLLQMTGALGLLAEGDHAEPEADADADADAAADTHEGSPLAQALVAFGVGTVPLSVVWQSFAIAFGVAGLAANTVVLASTGALATSSLALSLPVAVLVALGLTRLVARLVGGLVADARQLATSRAALVGRTGVVISTMADAAFGEVRLRDGTGHVLRVIARTHEGDAAIPEGREVVFVAFDPATERLFVAPLDDAPPP